MTDEVILISGTSERTPPPSVYLLITGAYENRGVAGVFATVDGAKAGAQGEHRPRESGIWVYDEVYDEWDWKYRDGANRFDDSAATIERYGVQR